VVREHDRHLAAGGFAQRSVAEQKWMMRVNDIGAKFRQSLRKRRGKGNAHGKIAVGEMSEGGDAKDRTLDAARGQTFIELRGDDENAMTGAALIFEERLHGARDPADMWQKRVGEVADSHELKVEVEKTARPAARGGGRRGGARSVFVAAEE